MFKDKILLITGGTGSFGNAVLERFLKTDIREIRIFSRDEKKQDDMRHHYNNPKIKFYLGDVRDINSIDNAMKGVNYIFHAAALKQVPSCEFFPIEAVKTNILGTDNLLNSAIRNSVQKVVCLSTDKAAYPVNAMGISKALMEKVFIARSKSVNSCETLICGTRYGNVIASRGSVIPLFINQILNNETLTVTNPNMTRFIMSLEEAVDLVIYAFNNAESGDIFVQKSPSCRIEDLAYAICDLFKVTRNYKIIGTRLGEKEYEVLLTKEEKAKAIDLGDYFRVPTIQNELSYEDFLEKGDARINSTEEYNSNNTKILTIDEIKEKLLALEYIQTALRNGGVK